MLNYVTKRKTDITSLKMSKVESKQFCLISEMEQLNLNKKDSLNGYYSLNVSKSSNSEKENVKNSFNDSIVTSSDTLNFEILKKIENKTQVKMLFNKLDLNNI